MALPLCGRRARSKLRVGAVIRAGSGGPADRPGRESYARYPLYPQADSAWIGRFFVTATVRGRDDLPATGDSLPSHSLSSCRAGRLRAAGRAEAKGRAADEAAARRKLRACPLADAKAVGFVKHPPVSRRPSGTWATTGGTPGLRVQDSSGGKRDFGPRAATGGTGASAPDLSGRTGFRPGSCETGGPRTQVHGRQAEPRLRLRIQPFPEPKLRPRVRDWREEGRKFRIRQAANRQGFGPVGEPAGQPDAASAVDGPRRKRRRDPRFRRRPLETARRGTPRLPG